MEGFPGRADTPASARPREEACAGGQGGRQTRSARRTGLEALCSLRPRPLFDRLPNVLPPELEACKSHRPTDHRSSHSAASKDRAAPQRPRPWAQRWQRTGGEGQAPPHPRLDARPTTLAPAGHLETEPTVPLGTRGPEAPCCGFQLPPQEGVWEQNVTSARGQRSGDPTMARRALTDGSLNFAQNLVIRDGPSTLVVRDDLWLFVDFLKRRRVSYTSAHWGSATKLHHTVRCCGAPPS